MKVGSKFSLLVLSLVFIAGFSSHGQNSASTGLKIADAKSRKVAKSWSFAMGGISLEEGRDNEAAALFYGGVNFDYQFKPWLNAHLSPRASIFSSRVQERYSDADEESRLWMFDGYLSVDPVEYFQLRGGALNQGYHGTGLLIASLRSFPGVQAIAKSDFGDFKMALVAQQVIPTSHSLNTDRASEEKLPVFATQTLIVEGRHFDLLQWKGRAGLFKWSNIPDKVVADSRLVGNVGVGENIAGSRFLYDHQGWYLATDFCLCGSYWLGAVFEFERVHNLKAPGDSADAQLIGVGPRMIFGDVEVDLRFRSYFSESDSTVASYSKSKFGNTNRVGYNIEAVVNFKKEGFSIIAENYQADPINRDINQRDLSIIYLGVETEYAPF